ncbi:Adenosylhomocysteine nucleosidase [Novosphingobium nitrogenifigens DSM 19370]|uniref:Adenosylhomocysteine nucleosidase n=1 Tax=Novosphingobium nitrogenifigens DSM 19370 TaxID=983920 RepID=F1ZAP4_9SPHN|nr:5'-methylthioadenosine/S-adenosylhomocysteine nucleosidase [Novosphingobium nitrogenifigens]EGD58319.1 Adenosylhomocysteine nucleosidase [Novosphingobium nitrogenifigens DSM 19370]
MIRRLACVFAGLVLTVPGTASAADAKLDKIARTVVMTAFSPEYAALEGSVEDRRSWTINGMTLLTGKLAGKPVVLMQSGVSEVNAAMNTQMVVDRFAVRRIVFSGIAGGVDPSLSIGDVVVPEQWGQYLEASFARATSKGWQPPETFPGAPANWQFIYPRGTTVTRADAPPQRFFTMAADPALVALARKVVPAIKLSACAEAVDREAKASPLCLPAAPRVVVGGTGVTAGIYADNAEFRQYLASAWHARVLDMESAAVIQVAYANSVPAIVFRSLSDLAGGDADANRMNTFMHLASINSAKVVRAYLAALPD